MNKCEWKDGKFVPCEKGHKFNLLLFDKDGNHIRYCPHCGADIRKPEPEVTIKQSGGTFVARCDGIDYVDTDPQAGIPRFDLNLLSNKHKWKPISEINVLEDIVNLNPNVIVSMMGTKTTQLIAVGHDQLVVFDSYNKKYSVKDITALEGLATVDDLP